MTKPTSILIASQDERLSAALQGLLTTVGFASCTYRPGDRVEDLLNTQSAAVVDIDSLQRGMQLAVRVKEIRQDFPIVLTSTTYRAITASEQRKLPGDAFISHPFPYFEMIDALRQLLRRKRAQSQGKSSAQLPIRGTLGDYPFELLLFKLFDSRFTGRLVLQRRKAKKVIYFLRGFPSSASSNTHTEAIGTLLVNRGVIRHSDLNRVLASLKEGVSFGEQLIAAGLLDKDQLRNALDEQVRERVLSSFEMRDGEWVVYPGDNFVHQRDHFVQNPVELIYLGVSRFEETNTLAERIQARVDHHVIPTRNFARLLPYFPVGFNRRALLSQINGTRTVGELFRSWNGDLPAFFRVVWALHASRLIFMSPSAIPTALPSVEALLKPAEYVGAFMSLRLKRRPNPHLSTSFQQLLTAKQARPLAALLQLGDRLDRLNHFELFGISPMATAVEIRAAVEERMRLFDPKALRQLPPDELTRITAIGRRLKQAAVVLLDPDARERYRMEVAPDQGGKDVERGISLLNKGRIQEAHDIFAALEARNPANARICAYLGRSLHLLHARKDPGALGQAAALLHRALALDEGYVDARVFLAELLVDMGEKTEAMATVQKALELEPAHQDGRNLRARLGQSVGLQTVPLGTLREQLKDS